MNFNLIILIFCFFIFLFFLYFLSKDDFVIIRKDISLERIFNLAILTSIFALFFARLLFAIFHPKVLYFNPLVFFALPYYPGLSLPGGIAGGVLFSYLYARVKKISFGRIFDLLAMSFIGVLPIGLIISFVASLGNTSLLFNIIMIFSIFSVFLFTKIIFPFSLRGEIEEGSLGLIFMLIFSFVYFTSKLLINVKTFSFIAPENLLLLIMLFASLIIIINEEIINKYIYKK